jgi:flavin reductase (DIM6/NTAB) family NADH-FMN oxidoreductase RutF
MSDDSARIAIGEALAAIPSGCCILTCASGGMSTGMLASWVQQAAFEPPMVTVAVKKGRPIEALIEQCSTFTLNALGEDPFELFKHFGSGFEPGEPAFEGLDTVTSNWGVELSAAQAVLNCRVEGTIEAGDHRVYVGAVANGLRRGEGKPYVHIRKNGFSY